MACARVDLGAKAETRTRDVRVASTDFVPAPQALDLTQVLSVFVLGLWVSSSQWSLGHSSVSALQHFQRPWNNGQPLLPMS